MSPSQIFACLKFSCRFGRFFISESSRESWITSFRSRSKANFPTSSSLGGAPRRWRSATAPPPAHRPAGDGNTLCIVCRRAIEMCHRWCILSVYDSAIKSYTYIYKISWHRKIEVRSDSFILPILFSIYLIPHLCPSIYPSDGMWFTWMVGITHICWLQVSRKC